MRVSKTATRETKLNLSGLRVVLYNADAASDPPNHARVIITIPGTPEQVTADLPLSEVLSKKQVAVLQGFQDSFVQALLAKEGLEAQPEEEA